MFYIYLVPDNQKSLSWTSPKDQKYVCGTSRREPYGRINSNYDTLNFRDNKLVKSAKTWDLEIRRSVTYHLYLMLFIIRHSNLTRSVLAMRGLNISYIIPSRSRHFPFFRDLRTSVMSFSVQSVNVRAD